VVATDHDWRRELAVAHHLVEGEPEAVALTETDPTDTRRQSLKRDAFARHVEPAVQVRAGRFERHHGFHVRAHGLSCGRFN